MAKKTAPPMIILETYVVQRDVGKFLGPYKVVADSQGNRIVRLTDKQAKYWLDQGTIVKQ